MMNLEEFKKGISDIEKFLKEDKVLFGKVYKEKRNYGYKMKVYNINDCNAIREVLHIILEDYSDYIITGEIQFYVVNRFGKRSIIIKWFDTEKEN